MSITYDHRQASSSEGDLKQYLGNIIKNTGKILEVEANGWGDWKALVDTEYAALRLAYHFRKSSTEIRPKGRHWIVWKG